jgi:hypothetical protein
MPNSENIRAPISLIGYGRSGTSVLFRAFAAHPGVDAVGESANLIFTTWRALEQISGITRYGNIDAKDYAEDAAGLVRNAFLNIFPSDKPYWMQKPIGIPRVHREFKVTESEEFVEWYWKVFTNSFPNSKNFSVVRHPKDVFLSARRYWKFPAEGIWRTLSLMYRIISYRTENFRIVVRHADLNSRPAEVVRAIAEAVELPYDESMLQAFETLHVPVPGTVFGSREQLLERRSGGFSHKDEWDAVPDDPAAEETMDLYRQLLSRFSLPEDRSETIAEMPQSR